MIPFLLSHSRAVYLYKGATDSTTRQWRELDLAQYPFLLPYKGKYQVDLAQKGIASAEELWTSTAWSRGSVAFLLTDKSELSHLVAKAFAAHELSNPRAGQSPGAYRLAQQEAANGRMVALFSASNGVEWLDLYAPDEVLESLMTSRS